jgi:hypothetical protein
MCLESPAELLSFEFTNILIFVVAKNELVSNRQVLALPGSLILHSGMEGVL